MFVNNIACRCKSLIGPNKSYFQLVRYCSTPQVSRRKDQFVILKEKLLENSCGFTPEFVNGVKRDVLGEGDRINSENFNSLFIEACIQNNSLELGKNFFHYLYGKCDNVGLAIIRKYFRLCYLLNESCDNNDKKFLLSLYEQVMKDYPLLDDISCENLSMGLSITDKWKDGLKLLEMSKEYGKPTNNLYCSLIRAAFDNGDQSFGWKLMEEMAQNEMKPHENVYSSILRKLYDSSVLELFIFLEKHGLDLPSLTASLLKEHKGGSITQISHKGYCQNCNQRLLPITLNDDEFKELTEDFLNPVLIGKDIFIKSKPSELNDFKRFLTISPKADIVLDGLNIAYSGSKKNLSSYTSSKMLMDVVKHFSKKNMQVTVLGRRHMKKWTKRHMNFINNNSSLFLAEDLSSDDSFLLYATMYSGLGTKFVSRDLMRGHKFLLKSPEMKKIFSKWQQKHQLFLSYVEDNGFVHLKDVSNYLMNTQCNENSWHIPIIEANQPGVQPHIQALNKKWLCIRLGNEQLADNESVA